jgi:starvation-inducible outer membrane lipoprotein
MSPDAIVRDTFETWMGAPKLMTCLIARLPGREVLELAVHVQRTHSELESRVLPSRARPPVRAGRCPWPLAG